VDYSNDTASICTSANYGVSYWHGSFVTGVDSGFVLGGSGEFFYKDAYKLNWATEVLSKTVSADLPYSLEGGQYQGAL
jgi:hypothetical protein